MAIFTLEYIKESLNQKSDQMNTVIFDFGGVLAGVSKEEENIFINNLKSYGLNDNQIREVIMLYYNIAQQDENMPENKFRSIYKKELYKIYPEYANLSEYIINTLSIKGKVFDYTIPLLSSLKNKGYKLYYLSNLRRFNYEIRNKNGFYDSWIKYFDGGIFSFQVKLMKPDPRIYKLLFKRYKLNPKNCIYVDDRQDNIDTAIKLGLKVIKVDREDRNKMVDELMNIKEVN